MRNGHGGRSRRSSVFPVSDEKGGIVPAKKKNVALPNLGAAVILKR